MITFFVPGVPVPQGSKRHVGHGVMVEQTNVLPWRAAIAKLAPPQIELLDCPVNVLLAFTFPRPKKHFWTGKRADELRPDAPLWHSQAPDADKLARAVLDALTGVVLRDDGRVAQLYVEKRYSTLPGVDIVITEIGSAT